jgi:uncharacterized protein
MKTKYFNLIKDIQEKDLIFSLYFTQLLLLTIAFILGLFLFDSVSSFLVLFTILDPNILLVGGTASLIVVLVDLIFMKLLPEKYYDDGGLNERIFQKRPFHQIAVIAAVVAIGEEILFRGVIQTHFGLIASSLLFAIVHYRYLFNWFLFVNIIALSFLIGFIYFQTGNLLVTIFMHFLVDFLSGCIIRYKFIKKHKEQDGIFDE